MTTQKWWQTTAVAELGGTWRTHCNLEQPRTQQEGGGRARLGWGEVVAAGTSGNQGGGGRRRAPFDG
jgi:hypothetical protein